MTSSFHDSVPGRKSVQPVAQCWPYQQKDTLTSDIDENWVAEVVTAQRMAGANVILSPGRYMSGDDAGKELDQMIDQFELSENLTDRQRGEVSALNLTLAAHWLTHDSKRDELLERLVEAAPPLVYARVLWPLVDTGAQPADLDLLAGYRELCEVVQSEGVRLLLPDSDLTGWLALSWGAAGFGTGIYAAARAFTPNRSGGGGGKPPKERLLERKLLHTILRDEHGRALAADLVESCSCTYCRMASGGHAWTPDIQGCHHVYVVGALAAALSASHPDVQVKEMVRAAQELYVNITENVALEKESIPRHLPLWSEVLR